MMICSSTFTLVISASNTTPSPIDKPYLLDVAQFVQARLNSLAGGFCHFGVFDKWQNPGYVRVCTFFECARTLPEILFPERYVDDDVDDDVDVEKNPLPHRYASG